MQSLLYAKQMLLDRGCPLDVADSRAGDTVLHLATRAGDNALLAVLLRKGANPDISNKVRPVRTNKWQLSILPTWTLGFT